MAYPEFFLDVILETLILEIGPAPTVQRVIDGDPAPLTLCIQLVDEFFGSSTKAGQVEDAPVLERGALHEVEPGVHIPLTLGYPTYTQRRE